MPGAVRLGMVGGGPGSGIGAMHRIGSNRAKRRVSSKPLPTSTWTPPNSSRPTPDNAHPTHWQPRSPQPGTAYSACVSSKPPWVLTSIKPAGPSSRHRPKRKVPPDQPHRHWCRDGWCNPEVADALRATLPFVFGHWVDRATQTVRKPSKRGKTKQEIQAIQSSREGNAGLLRVGNNDLSNPFHTRSPYWANRSSIALLKAG